MAISNRLCVGGPLNGQTVRDAAKEFSVPIVPPTSGPRNYESDVEPAMKATQEHWYKLADDQYVYQGVRSRRR